jgi:hypothetical protein
MNRTQKAIVRSWFVITASAFYLVIGLELPRFTPLLFLVLWQVARKPIDDNRKTLEFVSLRKGLPLVYVVFSITPMAWFVFRLITTPSLADTIWLELGMVSVPLLMLMAIYDWWQYSTSAACKAVTVTSVTN